MVLSTIRKSVLLNFFRSSFHSVSKMSNKTVLALLTEGTEEMELVVSVDVLRRAGIDVTVASINGSDVEKCSRGLLIKPDKSLTEALSQGPYDVVLLPGGPGHQAFAQSEKVGNLLKEQEGAGRWIAAICASPYVLKAHNVCLNKKVTCYPTFKEKLCEGGGYTHIDTKVVVDGKLITSQGPGTSFDFGLAIIEHLLSKEAALTVAKGLLL